MRNQKGFSLLEIMISMAVFAVGTMGLMQLQAVAAKFGTTSRRINEGTSLADELANRLQNLPYNDPLLSDTTKTNDSSLGSPGYNLEALNAVVDHCISSSSFPSGWATCQSNESLTGFTSAADVTTAGIITYYFGWDVEDANMGGDLARSPDGGLLQTDGKIIVARVLWRDPRTSKMQTTSAVVIRNNPAALGY